MPDRRLQQRTNTGLGNCTVTTSGTPPFSSVRLAHDGTVNCILLGTTSTIWYYPKVLVAHVLAGYSNTTGWDSGWTTSIITDETNITNIVTPTIYHAPPDYRTLTAGRLNRWRRPDSKSHICGRRWDADHRQRRRHPDRQWGQLSVHWHWLRHGCWLAQRLGTGRCGLDRCQWRTRRGRRHAHDRCRRHHRPQQRHGTVSCPRHWCHPLHADLDQSRHLRWRRPRLHQWCARRGRRHANYRQRPRHPNRRWHQLPVYRHWVRHRSQAGATSPNWQEMA